MRLYLSIATSAAILAGCQHSALPRTPDARVSAESCRSDPVADAQVAATVRDFFTALARDDHAALAKLTAPDFYAFEIGKRYSGAELFKLISEAHASGRILQWNIGPVDAHIDCQSAFAIWENNGASGTAGKLQPRAWLESAYLRRQGDRWVIAFLHSTPKDPRP